MKRYPTPQNDFQIDRTHNGAVCKEIGERLSIALGPQSIELNPRLLSLMKQLSEQLETETAGPCCPITRPGLPQSPEAAPA